MEELTVAEVAEDILEDESLDFEELELEFLSSNADEDDDDSFSSGDERIFGEEERWLAEDPFSSSPRGFYLRRSKDHKHQKHKKWVKATRYQK
jgi:hypothetical protein